MLNRTRTVVAALALLPIALASCSSGTGHPAANGGSSSPLAGRTIALLNGDNLDPYFLSIWAGASAEAKKLGIHLLEQAPTAHDYTLQLPIFNDLVAKQVDGIIFAPDSKTAFRQAYATAHGAGIPVVLVNDTMALEKNDPNVLSFKGSDPTLLGVLGAKSLAKAVGGSGLVSVINGYSGNQNEELRGVGFMDTIKKDNPGMTILPQQYDLGDISKAYAIATSEIQANPNLKGIYAVDSFTGQGVGTAIKGVHATGRIKLVAVDAEPQEVQLMRDGVIQALIAQQPFKMGVSAVDDLVLAIQGKASQVQRSLILNPIEVTPQNIDTEAMKTVVYSANKP